MGQVFHIIKIGVAVIAGIVAVVAATFFRDMPLAQTAAVISICFSVMPE